MSNELTNLLPTDRQKAVARNYLIRLATVAVILMAILVGVAAALLLPLYVYLTKAAATKEGRLAAIESTLAKADDANLSARLKALGSDANTLSALASASSTAETVSEVLTIPHAGISITTITYVPLGSTPRKITLVGVASTRDALHAYELALEQSHLFTSVNLPVSAFAQDVKIGFTLTLML